MTTIYLVRHAEAEGNLYRIAHGHYNSCITDDRGCRQIRALAERFRDVPVDAVYASDLIRTRTTAQSIYLPKGLQLHPDPAFREICMGEWEEHCWYELLRKYPQSHHDFNHRLDRWQVPGSETAQQVLDAPGRPLLFGTTEQFLRCFGVKSLEELPELNPVQVEEFKQQAEQEVQLTLNI
jgi:broad specificity phosphatase PhoE